MVSLTCNLPAESATMPQSTDKQCSCTTMGSIKPTIGTNNNNLIEYKPSGSFSEESDSLAPSPKPSEDDFETDEGIAEGQTTDQETSEDEEVFELTERLAAQALGSPIFTYPVYPPTLICYYNPAVIPYPAPTYKSDLFINYSMELVWHGEFQRLFHSFLPHTWHLSPTFSLPKGRKWVMFKDSAKVRFLCKGCAHGWTSMKGRVVFWFWFDEVRGNGMVLFRLFGQRCKVCSPTLFEHAMWYPEEVVKVVGNVFNRIGQEYYGFFRPTVRVDRRAGKPRAKHNTELCQACTEGICPGEFDASLEPQIYNSAEL